MDEGREGGREGGKEGVREGRKEGKEGGREGRERERERERDFTHTYTHTLNKRKQQTEDFHVYFSGRKRVLPRHSDLSFYNWDTNHCSSTSTPNFQVAKALRLH